MIATAVGNKVSKHLHGGGLKSCKLRMRVKFNNLVRTNMFPLVSCISNLFTSWHCLLKLRSILHGYLQSTYRCETRILSAMIWSQGGADYTTSPFPEHNYTGVVVQGFRSSCCYSRGLFGRVTQTSLLLVLMHKLIALSALALRWRQCHTARQ